MGVAVTDPSGSVAFAKATYPNDRTLMPSVINLIRSENASTVVIGESRDMRGDENPIMRNARRFAEELSHQVGVTVRYEPEFYSSVEARRDSDKVLVDAEAAAIILNSYISRIKGTPQ